MKPKATLRHFLAAIGGATLAISSAQAADGTWTQTATTQGDPPVPLTWSESGNWQDGIVAGGTDATAFFTQSATAAQTVTLDADVTLGNLTLNRNHNLTLATDAEEPKSLTLDVATGTPLVSIGGGRVLRINSVIAGSDGLEITGGGTASSGLVLTGANTFTGGILLNNGTLGMNQNFTSQAGLSGNHITVTGTSFAAFAGGTQITGGVEIAAGSVFRSGTNNSSYTVTGVLSGSGTLTHHQHGAGNQSISLPNTANTFTGRIDYDMPREATTIVSSLGDAEGAGNIRLGLAGVPTQVWRHHRFEFGSGGEADLVFNHRQFELLGTFENYVIRSNNANHAFVINTDLINSNARTSAILKFEGSGNQANTFAGNIGDGPGNGTDPSVLNINKLNGGTWILAGDNTYTGGTTVSAGTLTINGSLADSTMTVTGGVVNGSGTLTFNPTDQIDISGGTVDLSGFTVEGSGLTAPVYVIVDSVDGGSYTGTFAVENVPGYTVDYDYDGSGTQVALVSGAPNEPFDTWAATGTLPGTVTFDGDLNGDGVQDGLAFLLGVANPDDDANGNLPTVSEDGSGNLVMQFDCLPTADRGTAELRVAHSNNLASFTATVDQVPDANEAVPDNNVTFVVTGPSGTPSVNQVTATIDGAAAAAGKLFGRLKAEKP